MGERTIIQINTTMVCIACMSLLGGAAAVGVNVTIQKTLAEGQVKLELRMAENERETVKLGNRVSVIESRMGWKPAAKTDPARTAGQASISDISPADDLP